jgi:hypothetical protein
MHRAFLLWPLLALAAFAQAARPESAPVGSTIDVQVDPRMELFSIIFRLAGSPEYNRARHYPYVERVEAAFAHAVDHPVVKQAMRLRAQRGISYDAVAALAVHVTDAFALAERVPFDPLPATLDARWRPDEARRFLELARDFVEKTKFREFVAREASYHEKIASRLRTLLSERDNVGWLQDFFGARPGACFIGRVGLLNGGQNYGPMIQLDDGKEELYQIIGAWQFDAAEDPVFDASVVPIAVHEFCHSYVNHLVERRVEEFALSAAFLFERVKDAMQKQAYLHWKIMINESIVRACVVRHALYFHGVAGAQAQAESERRQGFSWTTQLAAKLDEYERDRSRYPRFELFMPQIVDFFDAYAAAVRQKEARSPASAPAR